MTTFELHGSDSGFGDLGSSAMTPETTVTCTVRVSPAVSSEAQMVLAPPPDEPQDEPHPRPSVIPTTTSSISPGLSVRVAT